MITEAGKRLLDGWSRTKQDREYWTAAIEAIEAEARADISSACMVAGLPPDSALWLLLDTMAERAVDIERARIGEAVGDMPHNMWTTAQGRERVLRIIDGKDAPTITVLSRDQDGFTAIIQPDNTKE